MPELPEVETVMRSVAPATVGRRVTGVWSSGLAMRGGEPVPAAKLRRALCGRPIAGWRRRAKYLLMDVEGGAASLVIHLGMSGRLQVTASGARREAHTHLVLGLEGRCSLRLTAPRRFARVACVPAEELAAWPPLATLGPEPLSRRLDARTLERTLAGRRQAIKVTLLDQRVVAGVGNIYASEALWEAGIDPRREAGSLDRAELQRLVRAVKATLRRAIRNCGTTLRDYRDGWGVRGRYQELLRVYANDGGACPRCGGLIESLRQAGRATYACLSCQG
jgi:formamidopyrimidine-DNA glycosylase